MKKILIIVALFGVLAAKGQYAAKQILPFAYSGKGDSVWLHIPDGGPDVYFGQSNAYFFYASPNYFPSLDSLTKFTNRYIKNSAIEAFTNLRLNTALNGIIQHLDSARNLWKDTLYAFRSNDSVYFKVGIQGVKVFMYKDSVGTGGGSGTVQVQNHITGDGSVGNKLRLLGDGSTAFNQHYGVDKDSIPKFVYDRVDTSTFQRYILRDTLTNTRSDQSSTVQIGVKPGWLVTAFNYFFGGTADQDSSKVGLLRSYDQGRSYKNLSFINIPAGKLALIVPSLYYRPEDGKLICIVICRLTSTTTTLYKFVSSDYGVTWDAGTDLGTAAGYTEKASDVILRIPGTNTLVCPYDVNTTPGDLSSTSGGYSIKLLKSTDNGDNWSTVSGFTFTMDDGYACEAVPYMVGDTIYIAARTRKGWSYQIGVHKGLTTWGNIQNTGWNAINSGIAVKRVGTENLWLAAFSPRWIGTVNGFEVRKYIDLYKSNDGRKWIKAHRISLDTANTYYLEPNITIFDDKALITYSKMGPAPNFKIELRNLQIDLSKFDFEEGFPTALPFVEVHAKHSVQDTLMTKWSTDAFHTDANGYAAVSMGSYGDSLKMYPMFTGTAYGHNSGIGVVGVVTTDAAPTNSNDAGVWVSARTAAHGQLGSIDLFRILSTPALNSTVMFRAAIAGNSPRIVIPTGTPLITGEEGVVVPTIYNQILYKTGANYPRMFWGHDGPVPYHPIVSIDKTISGGHTGFNGGDAFFEFQIQAGLAYEKWEAGQYDLTGGRSVDKTWYNVYPDNVLRQSMKLTTNAELIIGNGPAVPGAALYLMGRGATSGTFAMKVVNSSSTDLFQIDNSGVANHFAASKYNADYSANFTTDRHIPDIGYVKAGTFTFTNKTLVSPQITTPNLDASSTVGDVWTATNTTGAGHWAAPSGGGGGLSGTLTSGRVPYASGTSTLSDNANFLWDNTNQRLSVATTSASGNLNIGGSRNWNGATSGLQAWFTTGTYTDNTTAASGTASGSGIPILFSSPTFAASNTSVTLPNAYTVYIDKPVAGTNVTITNNRALYVNGDTQFEGAVFRKTNGAGDANYTVTAADYYINLPTITAGRTITLPSASTNTGRALVFRNTNSSGNSWQFGTAVKDGADASVTNLTNDTVYKIYSDGTNWNIEN